MDTLTASRSLRTRGFTRDQAEGIAEAIAATGLAGVKRDVDVLKWMIGAVLVILVAMFWQLFALNGTVARLDERMTLFGDRLGRVESGLNGVETRLTAVETRLSGVENRLSGVEAGQAAFGSRLDAVQTRSGPTP